MFLSPISPYKESKCSQPNRASSPVYHPIVQIAMFLKSKKKYRKVELCEKGINHSHPSSFRSVSRYLGSEKFVGDLVVEQTGVLLDEGDAELLGGLENGTVVLATAGGGNVLDAGASGAVDVVDEGELVNLC